MAQIQSWPLRRNERPDPAPGDKKPVAFKQLKRLPESDERCPVRSAELALRRQLCTTLEYPGLDLRPELSINTQIARRSEFDSIHVF